MQPISFFGQTILRLLQVCSNYHANLMRCIRLSAGFGPFRNVRTAALLIRVAWAHWRVDTLVARDIEELIAMGPKDEDLLQAKQDEWRHLILKISSRLKPQDRVDRKYELCCEDRLITQ
jgi:hypothetical protein